jgi:hypothetical protein
MLLPAANLLLPIGTIMAERFLYLPALGLIGCAVLGMYKASPRFAPASLCVVVTAGAARIWARNLDWRNDLTLGEAAVRSSPNSLKSHFLLAKGLYDSDPAHDDLDEVRAEVREIGASTAILDGLPDARKNSEAYRWAGGAYLLEGDLLRQKGEVSAGLSKAAGCAAAVRGDRRCATRGGRLPTWMACWPRCGYGYRIRRALWIWRRRRAQRIL